MEQPHEDDLAGHGLVFPAGRDVFFWFMIGDTTAFNGGRCAATVVSTRETLTGVTTAYIPGPPGQMPLFQAIDLNPFAFFPNPQMIHTQSIWMTHHELLSGGGQVPTYGVPTVGSLMILGLN